MKRTAIVLLALLTVAGPAQAYIISTKVGPLLKEATALIAVKNYKAALVKLNQAEAVKAWPDDEKVINQFRYVIASASLDPTQPKCNGAGMKVTKCDGRQVQP